MEKFKITTDGITDGMNPFELRCSQNPFMAVIIEFKRLLEVRGIDFPIDLVCKNGEKEITLEYSFLEAGDFLEKVSLVFNVEKIEN